MASQKQWDTLRDYLRSLDTKVKQGEVVSGPPWDLPSPAKLISQEQALDYLEAARRRLVEVEQAVKNAWESPIRRVQDAGKQVGAYLREAAAVARDIAAEYEKNMKESFEEIVDSMKETGQAVGFGVGAAVAIIIGLLLLRELK